MKKETTTPTKQSYVEPVGFKGTVGAWDLGYGYLSGSYGVFTKNMLDRGLNESPICLISPADKLNETDKANAKLISQSKEIAKALQDIVNDWIGQPPFKDEPEYKEYDMDKVGKGGYWTPSGKIVKAELIAKAQTILKEAGLTNE